MGVEVTGLVGLIILAPDVWAIISTAGSVASTDQKVLWIVLILVLPVIGFIFWFLLGPKKA